MRLKTHEMAVILYAGIAGRGLSVNKYTNMSRRRGEYRKTHNKRKHA